MGNANTVCKYAEIKNRPLSVICFTFLFRKRHINFQCLCIGRKLGIILLDPKCIRIEH